MFLLARRRLVVNALRLFWSVLALWYEHLVFTNSVHQCLWPDSGLEARRPQKSRPTHVLIVADPQILDHRSYPGRAPFLSFISQVLVDLNLRKSWRAALRTRPDIVVFLGDMMDGGRFSMSDDEYEAYFRRFKSIFPLDVSIPQYFIPGNHDTGLGVSAQFSEKAAARYLSHFGPLNFQITMANHTVVFLDAPRLVEEDYQRSSNGQSFHDWRPLPGGPVEFVQSFAKSVLTFSISVDHGSNLLSENDQNPVVLFTHIPLSRPDGSSCGPHRERGTIRQGTGFGYQNTIGRSASDFLLKNLKPSIVFSGDDHDYCEYTHSFDTAGKPRHVREVTVKSLSMAMGIRRPGFQLLSIVPPHSMQGSSAHADSLCLLPDQLGIYLSTYIPFLVLSLVVVFVANVCRSCSPRQSKRQPVSPSVHSPSYAPLSGALRSRSEAERLADDWLRYPSDNELDTLPRPTSSASKKGSHSAYSQTFVLFGRRRRMAIGTQSLTALASAIFSCFGNQVVPKSRGFAKGFMWDLRDIAVYPLSIFAAYSWWMFR
ncbi:Metallo-dependent phosphatase-like protein [Mycena crocata]|nr:Metallo-dependent phosphatase-like protein [Mycena crocata]